MKIICCLDKKNGRMFNNRRQSMDAEVRKNISKVLHTKNGQDHTADELLKGFEKDIYPENLQDLIMIRDYKKKFKYKWKLMFNKKYRKRNRNLILKLKFILNKV